eukprot:s512_g13.t1
MDDETIPSNSLGSVLNKGYERFYTQSDGGDMCVRRHPNGLFVIGLAPSHPLLAPSAPKVTQVTFGADLAENEAYGKRCRGGANVGLRTVLAEVTSEAESYNICCPIEARLVELNALLQEDPQLLQKAPEDEGFLAILQPRRPQDTQRILQKLLDESSYSCLQSSGSAASVCRSAAGPAWAPEPKKDVSRSTSIEVWPKPIGPFKPFCVLRNAWSEDMKCALRSHCGPQERPR